MLELCDVGMAFRNGKRVVPVLQGIDLRIEPHDFAMLLGRSGSGKSTLLSILGLLNAPTGGSYRFEGRDVAGMRKSQAARLRLSRIGFVFQSFHLIEDLNAIDNVCVPLGYAGVGRRERVRIAEELLERVGLRERARHRPGELSGGECQRVAIARALANRPGYLFADEPTGSLDSANAADIMRALAACHDAGTTIVMVTHDESLARHATRTIRLADGRIVGA